MAAILIIDDDVAVRRLLRQTLERAQHIVAEAKDGAEGMALHRTMPFDLVITDLFMPDQDGIETIQQLREEFPRTRILAISGGAIQPVSDALVDAQLLGADATLAKPFTIDELTQQVAALLGKRDGRSEP